jgi:hypothetical protein
MAKWKSILLVLIGIAAVGAIIYVQNPQVSNFGPTPTDSPTTTPSETANWLQYSHPQLEFSFQYPPEATLEERENGLTLFRWGPTQREGTEVYDGYVLNFNTVETEEELNIYAQEQLDQSAQDPISEITQSLTQTTLGGQTAYTYSIRGLGEFQMIMVKHPTQPMIINISDLTADPGNLGFAQTVSQILSSFKFSN